MLTVADNTVRSLCFQHLRMCALIAMSILHRLGLLQKFMILGTIGLMMSALPTYLYVSDSLRSIAAARHESVGAVPALVVNKVVQLMQVHRGLSAGMLGGDEALAARRPAARDALEKAMA